MFSPNSDSEDIPWDKLPFVTLVLIYKFLENPDRFNASLVCHSWFHAFESGTLWKTNFVFSGDMVDDSRKALKFAKTEPDGRVTATITSHHITVPKAELPFYSSEGMWARKFSERTFENSLSKIDKVLIKEALEQPGTACPPVCREASFRVPFLRARKISTTTEPSEPFLRL
ncbi:f-box domain-containing protein [Caerostris extrusa]|uniref:F-box domain-containing protein n=1 Tax=Caerostris extrusa TaxID=172846 RepID=A0AAV4WGH6_CAEEX|nr:f-box domain-containing protein [Caerostris extrusa]